MKNIAIYFKLHKSYKYDLVAIQRCVWWSTVQWHAW